MVRTLRKIKFDRAAITALNSAIIYIQHDSVKNAEKVKKDLLLKIRNLALHPEKYSLDKFKHNNDGSFRAFELHHYRVAYQVGTKEIKIVRVRHTSMEPKKY